MTPTLARQLTAVGVVRVWSSPINLEENPAFNLHRRIRGSVQIVVLVAQCAFFLSMGVHIFLRRLDFLSYFYEIRASTQAGPLTPKMLMVKLYNLHTDQSAL